jgi:hypothetical protein
MRVIQLGDAYAVVTVNGDVIVGGLTNPQAWRELERRESKSVESTMERVWRYQRER